MFKKDEKAPGAGSMTGGGNWQRHIGGHETADLANQDNHFSHAKGFQVNARVAVAVQGNVGIHMTQRLNNGQLAVGVLAALAENKLGVRINDQQFTDLDVSARCTCSFHNDDPAGMSRTPKNP